MISTVPDNANPPRTGGSTTPSVSSAAQAIWATLVVLSLALLWSYWPTFVNLAETWAKEPQYSHGFLVPVFAAVLLYLKRDRWQPRQWRPSLWGVLPLSAAVLLRLLAARLDSERLDEFSLLPMLAGVVLLVGGTDLFRWTWPAIAFLAFMLRLPFVLEQGLSQPLRQLATVMSAYSLETLGYPAIAEGNVILIDDLELKVAEACSGLGMLMTFFALATAFAMVMPRGWVDRIVIVGCAIPIAVLANVLRITATGIAYVGFGQDSAKFVMHDVAGWFMMPIALAMLFAVLWLLDRLFPYVEEETPLHLHLGPQ